MNKKELETLIENKVRKILSESDRSYWRASKHAVGNILYSATKRMQSLFDSLTAGNDFDPSIVDGIIQSLQIIKKTARQFKKGTSLSNIPKDYQ